MSQIHLFVDHDRNRELLADWLSERYEVTTRHDDLPHGTDLCVVDERGFAQHRERLQVWKNTNRPVFSPVLLVSEAVPDESLDPDEWETIDGLYIIDEIVSVPVEKAVLYRRLENLLERRSLSEELTTRYERSQTRFRSLFHATPDPAFVVSGGRISYANDAFCSQTGLDREQVIDTPLAELPAFDEESLRKLLGGADAAMSTTVDSDERGSETVTLTNTAGEHRSFETNLNPMQMGDRRGVVVVLRDVTERLRRERDLKRTEQRFEQIATNVNELLWLIDVDVGTIEYMSPGFETLVGSNVEIGPNESPSAILSLVHPDDTAAVEDTIDRMIADAVNKTTDDAYHFEFRIENGDGGTRWLEGDGYPIRDDDGGVHRYVGVFEDFTEYKQRERLLERQNERLEEFAGIVSHDLRNPIQVLVARLDQLANGAPVDDHLPAMDRALGRMEGLIDDLLSLAQEGETVTALEPISLAATADDAWTTIDSPSATLLVESDTTFVGDPSRFQQLLANLFRNAVEHGGLDVTVRVGALPESRDDARGLYVADDGPGIPVDQRERVLERGYSTQDNGTGFGLNIVTDIVEAHGWEIAIDESADGGARFELSGLDRP